MRRFSSYGPINPKLHYYASREGLIDKAYTSLMRVDTILRYGPPANR